MNQLQVFNNEELESEVRDICHRIEQMPQDKQNQLLKILNSFMNSKDESK